jgi:hypothetical protein
MEEKDLLNTSLVIDDAASYHLLETAIWGKFLAIVGFVLCGLFVLLGFGASAIFSSLGSYYGNAFSGNTVFLGVFYALFSLLYFFPCLYLYRFSVKMKLAIATSSQELLVESLSQHRRMYRFVGILTIIAMSIYALALLIIIAGLAIRG